MKRIIIISDTHIGTIEKLPPKVLNALKEADIVIHAGDADTLNFIDELEDICKCLYAVKGNCDLGSKLPVKLVEEIEGELAVIIGKKAKNVAECHAMQHILGYTIANDITAPQKEQDLTVTIGKFFDTFAPLGPCIVTDIDVSDVMINTYKNGELVQSGSTKDMIFDIAYQISYLSSIMTLLPGDIILTGTPSAAVEVHHNDKIDITIDNIGTLTNQCISGKL